MSQSLGNVTITGRSKEGFGAFDFRDITTVDAHELFGSGLTQYNPSSMSAMERVTTSTGAEFLFVGDQDVLGAYGTARAGSVHVWKRTAGEWVYHSRLSPPSGFDSVWMGHGISADGDWLACGNTHQSISGGSVGEGYVEMWKYVSGSDLWVYQQRLQPTVIIDDDEFGLAVAVSGDWLIAGAPYHASGADTQAGRIWFFENVAGVWTERQDFREPVPRASNNFGSNVEMHGEWAFAYSADFEDGFYLGVLQSYRLTAGTWAWHSEITPSGREYGLQFGRTCKFDGTTLAVSGFGSKTIEDDLGEGGLHIFTFNGTAWTQDFRFMDNANPLMPETSAHRWGDALDVSGNTVVVGCRFADFQTSTNENSDNDGKGIVYVFERIGTTWHKTAAIYPADRVYGDWFGEDVLIDGADLLIVSSGAYRSAAKTMILDTVAL